MAMPRRSFCCTAGLQELGNSTFPSLSRCWPATTLAAATERTINGAAMWRRMFMSTPYSKLPGAAILAAQRHGELPQRAKRAAGNSTVSSCVALDTRPATVDVEISLPHCECIRIERAATPVNHVAMFRMLGIADRFEEVGVSMHSTDVFGRRGTLATFNTRVDSTRFA